jgi:hypothetical protein
VKTSPALAGHLRTNLREAVRSAKTFSGGQVTTVLDPATVETLRALGYVQ